MPDEKNEQDATAAKAAAPQTDAATPSTAPDANPAEVESFRDKAQATFRRVQFSIRMGHPDQALRMLQPLLDQLEDLSAREPDSEPLVFDFANPEQAYLYFTMHPQTDLTKLRSSVGPYVDAYGIQAALLYETGDFEGSAAAADRAIRWAPTDAGLYLERAMAHEAADQLDKVEEDIEEAYPLITLAIDMARYHAFRADVLVSQGKYDLAAAHFAVYHDFDPNDTYAQPDEELHELGHRTGRGHAYQKLTSTDARKRLDRAGEKYGPSDLATTVLQQIMVDGVDTGDLGAASNAAEDLWAITRDQKWKDLMEKIDAVSDAAEGDGEDDGNE